MLIHLLCIFLKKFGKSLINRKFIKSSTKEGQKKSDKEDWIQNIVNKFNKKGISADSNENKVLLMKIFQQDKSKVSKDGLKMQS